MNQTDQTSNKLQRRSFLKRLWLGAGIVGGIEAVYIALNFVKPRKSTAAISTSNYFEVGSVQQFKKNSITSFRNRNFFLCCLDNGEFIALSSKCTHLGCALTYNQQKNFLECPCHSSSFNIKGEVLRSPATKELDRYPIKIEKDIIKVDLANTMAMCEQHTFLNKSQQA